MIQEMQEYYSKRANYYDQSMGYEDPEKVALLQPVIDYLCEQLEDRIVLEIACGPGFWTGRICSAVKKIVATDVNESTLEVARIKDLPWNKVALKIADAYDLRRHLPKAFEGAMAVDWFSHVPKSRMHGFLENLHSRLKENSVVVFCDQLPKKDSKTHLFDAEGNHVQERTLSDGSRHFVIKHYLTDDEIHGIFSPYSKNIEIQRFPDCRRLTIAYTLKG